MHEITVSARSDGGFDLPAEGSSWRVVYERMFLPRPWVVVAMDGIGIHPRCAMFDSYADLDEALSAMVATAAPERARSGFTVVLPDGRSFLRPGKVAAQDVISALGWVAVKRFIGYLTMPFDPSLGPASVRNGFLGRLTGLGRQGIRLGIPTPIGQARDGRFHWCTDVRLDFMGLVAYRDVNRVAEEAFIEKGLFRMLPTYDFVPLVPVVTRGAEIKALPIGGGLPSNRPMEVASS